MGGLARRSGFLAAALCGLAIIPISAQAAESCVEINFQTRAENRLKAGRLIERQVGIFFAGTTVNALSASEKTSIEAELDRFFHAFRAVFVERRYVWNANTDMVRRAQAQFDYLVVIDAELNAGSLPKYDENLNMYKGKPIDPELIGFVDALIPPKNENIPAAFVQVVDVGPTEAYVMFAEILLLAVGVETTVIHSDYAASLRAYVAGSVADAGGIGVLRQQHENLVYSCLAPVFD
jgi:hypothetical protein